MPPGLYTPLVRLKQAMNDGTLPPMTPVPESVHDIIDPAFTIGLGALDEDPEKGLRCPVRGCGEWMQSLRRHIRTAHPVVGVSGVCRALSIPERTPLMSQRTLALLSEKTKASGNLPRLPSLSRRQRSEMAVRARQTQKVAHATMGARNLRNSCVAQLTHKLLDLKNRLGRTPVYREAALLISDNFGKEALAVFGSWNNALAHAGISENRRRGWTPEQVIEALGAYYAANGVLPSNAQCRHTTRLPLLPTDVTIKKVLGEPTWYDCMRKAARILGIRDGRYGLLPFPDEERRESA